MSEVSPQSYSNLEVTLLTGEPLSYLTHSTNLSSVSRRLRCCEGSVCVVGSQHIGGGHSVTTPTHTTQLSEQEKRTGGGGVYKIRTVIIIIIIDLNLHHTTHSQAVLNTNDTLVYHYPARKTFSM